MIKFECSFVKTLFIILLQFFFENYWYSNLYSDQWLKESGLNMKAIIEKRPNLTNYLILQMILNVLTIIFQNFLLSQLALNTLTSAIIFTFGLWFFFIYTFSLRSFIWEAKSLRYVWINTGSRLYCMMLLTLIYYY